MKAHQFLLLIPGILCLLLGGSLGTASGGNPPPPDITAGARSLAAAKPLDAQGRMQLSPEDRCPVCAMQVTAHQKFASAIQLVDNTTYYFCGTGCMIRSWMHPEIYLGVDKSTLKHAVVRDYFTGAEIDAAAAYWISGSDVVGPMGPALVPLASSEDVAVFQKRHGGGTVFRLSEMNDARWEEITGRKAVPGKHH